MTQKLIRATEDLIISCEGLVHRPKLRSNAGDGTSWTVSDSLRPDDGGAARRNLLYARLITFMQLAEESAEIAYPRRLHMPNISRQLIFMIGLYGSVASKDLAMASGREKAQISRGVKVLAQAGLVDRTESRRSISLSPAGRATFLDVMKVARERDNMLRRGLADDEIARFLEMTATLIDRASSIFVADEQTAAIDLQERSSVHHPPEPDADLPRTSIEEPSFRDLILPWLQSLLTYMRRSGTTLFRREVGLSNFEWRLLSLIAETQPINLSSLIALVSRDKSQVARMVKQLHAAGLIDRRDEGRVNAALTMTPAGHACYARIRAISIERDRFLFGGHGAEERTFYFEVMDRLTANAAAMLDEEEIVRGGKDPVAGSGPARARPAPVDEAARAVAADLSAELRQLREENARLKQLLAEAILENARLRDRAAQDA